MAIVMNAKFFLLIILMLSAFNVSAKSYWYVSYGDGDDTNSGSAGFGVSAEGGGFEIALFGDEFGSSYLNYRVPHNSYWILSSKDGTNYKQQSKFGLDLKKYIDVSDALSVSVGVGGYTWNREKIAQSTATYLFYLQETKYEFELTELIGLQYILNDYLIGLEAHTLRGTVFTFGKSF